VVVNSVAAGHFATFIGSVNSIAAALMQRAYHIR
jgi:hypothetical protein